VKNIVSVSGHGSSAGTFGPSNSNEVTVVSSDAPSTATTTKSYVSTTNACFTVRYGVSVHNSSAVDENITLTGLTDNTYGDITTVHDNVLATTCTIPAGGVALNVSGSDYTCNFNATFCGTPGNVTGTTCTNGVQHTNTVTPTLVGDDTPPEAVTNSGGSLTVTQCLNTTSQ
jgi:hypothetical protein